MLDKIQILKGAPTPLGLSFQDDQANFALLSKDAAQVILCLFGEKKDHPEREISLNRTGDVWHAAVETSKNLMKPTFLSWISLHFGEIKIWKGS